MDVLNKRFPSVKTIIARLEWLDKVGDPEELARKVRGLLDGTLDPATVSARVRFEDRKPAHRAYRAHESHRRIMLALNELLETCGIEYIPAKGCTVWGGPMVAEYLNTGHTYAGTVLFDYDTGRFHLCSWGDYVERRGL